MKENYQNLIPLLILVVGKFFDRFLNIGLGLFMPFVFLHDFSKFFFNMGFILCDVKLRRTDVDGHNVDKIHKALKHALWYLTHQELEDFQTKFKAKG
jgi:hypothetical protein